MVLAIMVLAIMVLAIMVLAMMVLAMTIVASLQLAAPLLSVAGVSMSRWRLAPSQRTQQQTAGTKPRVEDRPEEAAV